MPSPGFAGERIDHIHPPRQSQVHTGRVGHVRRNPHVPRGGSRRRHATGLAKRMRLGSWVKLDGPGAALYTVVVRNTARNGPQSRYAAVERFELRAAAALSSSIVTAPPV